MAVEVRYSEEAPRRGSHGDLGRSGANPGRESDAGEQSQGETAATARADTPIGEILQEVGADGVLLESPGAARYAVLPLDDDMIDYLLERSPRLRKECEEIRQRMADGRFRRHDEVRQLFEKQ